MADGTKIEWTDATWNVVNGCSVVSPGCTNCYAMKLAGTRLRNVASRKGLTRESKAGPVWTGETRLNEAVLTDPLRWRRPRRIFVCAHGDLFHESVPAAWIDRVFAVMALAPQHQFQVLTKRAERMRAYIADITEQQRARPYDLDIQLGNNGDAFAVGGAIKIDAATWPLRNVWLGVSVEDQARADERVPHLLATPAAKRFLSCEPLLGSVNLTNIDCAPAKIGGFYWVNALTGEHDDMCRPCAPVPKLDWIIAGGESGPGARPMHPDWARNLRDQCAEAGVPFFHKQNGNFAPGEIAGDHLDPTKRVKGLSYFDGRWIESWSEVEGHCDDEPDVYPVGKKRAGRLLDGVEHNGFPAVAS